MCGIVAICLKNAILSPDVLTRSLHSLAHRGPDGYGQWIDDTKQVGLGHARLSIIDLKTGTQPLTRSDRRLHAIVNGEFYDYQSIREKMMAKGYDFQTQSDSEIVLALYTFYGTECFQYLNGEFAFVLYDEEKGILFAARDHFGVKPLFWANHQGHLYFASEAKAILSLGLPARWNEEAIWRQLGLLPSSEQSSCFQDVKAIKPGHYMIVNVKNNETVQRCYWDVRFFTDSISLNRSEEDTITQFEELFTNAIKRRLQADVPVACYLSGGIDSSAIAVIAARESSHSLTAFTVAFDESQTLNETEYAKRVAAEAGLNHLSLSVSMRDIVTHYGDTVWHTEWPIQNGSFVAKYLLSRYARDQGYKVVLTGEGSDELLAGYSQLWKDYRQINSSEYVERASSTDNDILTRLGYVPELFRCNHVIDKLLMPLYSQDFQKKIMPRNMAMEVLDEINPGINAVDHFATSLYLGLKTNFPAFTLSVAGDRTEMAHSIESRLPFLDTDLVQFLLSLPHPMRVKDGVEKYLLRESMKTRLHKAIHARKKHPFSAPSFHTGNKIAPSPIYNTMREVFYSEMLTNIPFLNQKAVISFFERTVYQVQDPLRSYNNQILHDLLSLCFLGSRFKIS